MRSLEASGEIYFSKSMLIEGIQDVLLRYRFLFSMIFHMTVVFLAYAFAFGIRFDFNIPGEFRSIFLRALPLLLFARLAAYCFYKIHSNSWRLVSLRDTMVTAKAVTLGSVLFIIFLVFFQYNPGCPRSVILLEPILTFLASCGVRFILRYYYETSNANETKHKKSVLIVGAGKAGSLILNEIQTNSRLGIQVSGFVDDDPYKKGTNIHGIPVLGNSNDLTELVSRFAADEVIIAIPSAKFKEISRIKTIADKTGAKTMVLPGLSDLINDESFTGQLRDVSCDELLGRGLIKFRRESDLFQLENEISGKTVLVTGAGGSIGSELCRQVAQLSPKLLIMYERYESSLYELELDLERTNPNQQILPIVGDVLDTEKFDRVLREQKVELIYHAAAYKHVPMMEREPIEAIRNNVFGTMNVSRLAVKNGVAKFVLISTDKAVRPSSVMGTTKRIAELIIRSLCGKGTKFVAVRFGNVLGSNGSVIPLFKRQIGQGGPITVTHPETTRYFMAISEAVQLVMVAGTMGNSGEVFLLDMGEPVKIADLAERLVSLSGLKPNKDVDIVYTGLRPGEKVHEELYWRGKGIVPTENKKITVWRSEAPDTTLLYTQLEQLRLCEQQRNKERAIQTLNEIVPEATITKNVPQQEHNKTIPFSPYQIARERERTPDSAFNIIGLREGIFMGELAAQREL
jgi:FlaA1/EpsC-like NDP-sugar epimerase